MPTDPVTGAFSKIVEQWGVPGALLIIALYTIYMLAKKLIELYDGRIVREQQVGEQRREDIKILTDLINSSRVATDAACTALNTAVGLVKGRL